MPTRRRFLGSLSGALAALAAGAGPGWTAPARCSRGSRVQGTHPAPRPGVDASHVLPRARLRKQRELAEVFDMVREMPHVVDGIRCHCGCADQPGYYSLLSCFEGEAMAQQCEVCQGQARLAYKLFKAGKSLGDIRAAIDAEFG